MEGLDRRSVRKRRLAALAAVAGLSAAVQCWLVLRAEVPSLDAVRFVRAAQAIDRDGLLPALRVQREQPLFAVSVWAVHCGLTVAAGEFRSAWAVSVQVAAAAALVLAVVPVYLLGARLWGTAAGTAGAVLFSVLPEVARLGADGLSDSTHLLFAAVAIWATVAGLGSRTLAPARSWPWLFIAGLATGVAALARAEVLVVPAALFVTLGVLQMRGMLWRLRLVGAAASLAAFSLGAILVLVPYLAVVGSLSPRQAWARLQGCCRPELFAGATAQPAAEEAARAWQLSDGRPMSFAAKDPSIGIRRRGLDVAAPRFARKLAEAYGYWVGGLALFGLWRARRRPIGPAPVFLAVLFVLFSAATIRFAAVEGYLEARHLVVLVGAGAGAAGCGALELGAWLARRSEGGGTLHSVPLFRPLPAWSPLVLSAAACLALLGVPLHASRAGHRGAAEWLAREAPRGSLVIDTRGWTGLYSGLLTRPYDEAPAALADSRLAYVVVEKVELHYKSPRGHTLRKLLEAGGTLAAVFPARGPLPEGWQPVEVYRWDAARFKRWAAEEAAASPGENRYARSHGDVSPHGGRSL